MGQKLDRQLLSGHSDRALPPQEILDLFKTTFDRELYDVVEDFDLENCIQEVKTDLYNRDYLAAFNTPLKRVAYCCRWSPSRSLGYASLFAYLQPVLDILSCQTKDNSVLCIGGGAGGELVALSSIFALSRRISSNETDLFHNLSVQLVDIAEWSNVTDRLLQSVTQKWMYAGNIGKFNCQFTHKDILTMQADELRLSSLDLITSLFTTNELFQEHRVDSIKLLQKFNQCCARGCYLLIVESAGSYSHITIGTKRFPIQFLIDTVLVGKPGDTNGAWSLVSQNDSIWYRGDVNLDYPLKLENMRFFYRLYRKN